VEYYSLNIPNCKLAETRRGGARRSGNSPARWPPRHAKLVQQLQLAPELGARDFAAQKLAILRNGLRHLGRSFVQELDAEVPHTQFQQLRHVFRSSLRTGVE